MSPGGFPGRRLEPGPRDSGSKLNAHMPVMVPFLDHGRRVASALGVRERRVNAELLPVELRRKAHESALARLCCSLRTLSRRPASAKRLAQTISARSLARLPHRTIKTPTIRPGDCRVSSSRNSIAQRSLVHIIFSHTNARSRSCTLATTRRFRDQLSLRRNDVLSRDLQCARPRPRRAGPSRKDRRALWDRHRSWSRSRSMSRSAKAPVMNRSPHDTR